MKSFSQGVKHRWTRLLTCLLAVITVIGLLPMTAMATNDDGDTGGHNPGSPGGQSPTTTDVAWSTIFEQTFMRFTLIEFPQGVVADLNTNDGSTWRAVGTPLNVVWNSASYYHPADYYRSNITWYDSNAMMFNGAGTNAPQLMGSTVTAYNASSGNNRRRVITADEFQDATGITDQQKEQMFHLNSSTWSTNWLNGDYTSMWGTDPHPVTSGNFYNVYKANDAFVYLLTRLSETSGAGTGWSTEDALSNWADTVYDSSGNLRTKYRIIIETGGIVTDPDGVRRAYTLREMLAYSLYNNEADVRYNLIWDQATTMRNMARWMRQAKDNQFVEYPLDATGTPTGEELHSTNGFREANSFVDSIQYATQLRSTIFSERRSYGLHILNPFNFEAELDLAFLEVTKQTGGSIAADQTFGFTVTYTAGSPTGFTATKNDADYTSAVTETGSGLRFTLKGGETVRFAFVADDSFRCTVSEDDPSMLTSITGTGGTADTAGNRFTTTGSNAKATFTNVYTPPPAPARTILYKRDANTNAGVGPATFKFSSVVNGDYEFDTNAYGELEELQWWDPTESVGRYIKPGEYTVTELIPPPNYTASDEVKQIRLELDEFGDPIPAGPLVFTNLAKPGLRIVKYDRLSHRPMSGVSFDLYRDGTFIGRYETDAAGEIVLNNIDPGTYCAVEVDTGDSSHILDGSYLEIELEAGDGIKELIFFNAVLPGMKLVKVDASDPAKVIPGAVFEIKSVAGDYGPVEFTTNFNGEIDLSHLPEGAYVVTEKSCPGYVIDDGQRVIYLRANDTAEFVFSNTRKPSLRLVKTGADGTPLAGVTFRIAKIGDGTHYLDRTTGADGEIYVEDLEPGVYSVVEIATLPDYILDKTEHHVELSPGKTAELRLTNNKRPSLTIRKIDKDTGAPVPGVTFTLRAADGATITTEATGPDGTVTVSNLLPGVYTVMEQSVPENYILDTTPQSVTLFPNRDAQVVFQDYQRPALKIAKVDINGKYLTGAIFEVKTKAGVVIGDFPVGADGTVTVPNTLLDEGYYIITEKQAPEGYILDSTPHEVYLRPGKTTEISIVNERKPGLTVYKIDSVVGDGIKGAKFQIWRGSDNTTTGDYYDLGVFYTDENGIIHLDNLDTGWYKIVEVEPAAGFSMKEPHEQIIYIEHDKAVEVTFENTPLNAIVVQKYDSVTGEPLAGCTFQLRYLGGASGTGGTIIGQKVTGKNGVCMWTGLEPGAYIVEEISAADGYSITNASETVYLADNGEQSVITLIFTNSPDGSLLIRKVCAVNPSVTLQNAEFKVTYSDGTLIGDSNGIFVTDENGQILITGLTPGKSVVVTEVKAPPGFIIDSQSQTIQIKEGRTVSLTFKNQPKGSLIIQKRDSQTGKVLPGAEFRITTAAGCEVGLDGVIGTSTLTQNGIFTTDAQGEIKISNLAPGAYIISEVKAPAGYVMDSASINVVIGTGGDTQTVVVTNSKAGTLVIDKRDSLTGKPLEGVAFKVTTSTGEFVPNENGQISSNGLYFTDKDGKIVINGVVGTLVVTETATIPGYTIDEATRTQTVVVYPNDTQTLYFTNTPSTTLVIEKYIEGTTTPLKGVTFLVTDSSGAAVGRSNGEYITDENGRIVISGLTPGTTVTAREVKTLEGYVLDTTPKSILIKAGEVQTLRFYNQKQGAIVIRKLDEQTGEPLAGVEFEITYSDGSYLDDDYGHLSSKGLYKTDSNGEIRISGVVGTLVITEIRTLPGYVIDEGARTKTVKVNPGDTQTVTFYNTKVGGLELIKVSESNTTQRIPGTTFEIRRMDGGLVTTVTTGSTGRVHVDLDAGDYYAVEIIAAQGFQLDDTPHYFTVTDGKTTTLTVKNKPFSGILIHKTDSVTGKGIPGVSFLLYDSSYKPIGQYVSDNSGYVYIENLAVSGRYYLRELENAGYAPDTQLKTVYVIAGETTLIEWQNTPVMGQIQITKKSADYNPTNGLPAGTLLEGAVFEIYDKAGNLVDTIRSDSRGVAVSKPLPLGRYTVREVKAPDNYGISSQDLTAYLEYAGEIVRFEVTNKSITTGVSITKTGPKEAMANQPVNYTFSGIANTSNVMLTSFYWRDTLPAEVRLDTVVTGTYNFPGAYKITYRVNGGEYRTLADNLSTGTNYTLAASPAALGLASNERVTEIMFVFGQAPAGFAQLEKPMLKCTAISTITTTAFTNVADVGGVYNGQWIQAVSRWVTTVYKPTLPTLPKTGY